MAGKVLVSVRSLSGQVPGLVPGPDWALGAVPRPYQPGCVLLSLSLVWSGLVWFLGLGTGGGRRGPDGGTGKREDGERWTAIGQLLEGD